MTTQPSPESGTTEPSDSEMLDWLETVCVHVDINRQHVMPFIVGRAGRTVCEQTFRAAIRSAMKGEK